MIEEHQRVFGITCAIALVAALAFAPFDRAVSAGLVAGTICLFAYLRLLTRSVTARLVAAVDGGSGAHALPSGKALRMLVLALPLLLAGLFPQRMNVFAAVAPILASRLVTFALLGGLEGHREVAS